MKVSHTESKVSAQPSELDVAGSIAPGFNDNFDSFDDVSTDETFHPAERTTSTQSFTLGGEYTDTGKARHEKIAKLSKSIIKLPFTAPKGNIVFKAMKPKSVFYKDKKAINCRLPETIGEDLLCIDINSFIEDWAVVFGCERAPTAEAVISYCFGMINKLHHDQNVCNKKESELSLSWKRKLKGSKEVIDCGDALLLNAGFIKENPLYRSSPKEGYNLRKYVLEDQYLVTTKYKIAKVYLKDMLTPEEYKQASLSPKKVQKSEVINNNCSTKDLEGRRRHNKSFNNNSSIFRQQEQMTGEQRDQYYRNLHIESGYDINIQNAGYAMTFAANSERKSRQRSKNRYGWGDNQLSIL